MATIKACPCCGTPAKLFENHYGTIAEYWVICPECRLGTTWHPTEAAAIAAWNQRAGEAEIAALRELQKAVDYEILPMKTIASTLCAIYPDAGRLLEWLGELESLTSCDKEMK